MQRENERFDTTMFRHVWNRIMLKIWDKQGDEYYQLDMPPDVYEELKQAIKEYDNYENS